ncbi:MAG: hypothetical protein U5R06_07355 [candidate division KSB1 bacterium]|nr:hypothetical protein [candidate division KSB1 bacterium]
MRTIRILVLLIASALMQVLFIGSSCDNGVESKKEESIVGNWRMSNVVMKNTPVGDMSMTAEQFLELSGTGATSSVLLLNEDGSASVTTTYTGSSDVVVDGTYSLNGDELIINDVGIDNIVGYDIDGNTLTITVMMPIDFDSDGTDEDIEVDMVYNKV